MFEDVVVLDEGDGVCHAAEVVQLTAFEEHGSTVEVVEDLVLWGLIEEELSEGQNLI